jgi:hypothetical protein
MTMSTIRRNRGRRRWLWVFALLTLASLFLLPAAGALAQDEEAAAGEEAAEAPTLDYSFTWPTFLITFLLVIGYHVFIYRMSEKEFKGVIAERFGPKRS